MSQFSIDELKNKLTKIENEKYYIIFSFKNVHVYKSVSDT